MTEPECTECDDTGLVEGRNVCTPGGCGDCGGCFAAEPCVCAPEASEPDWDSMRESRDEMRDDALEWGGLDL